MITPRALSNTTGPAQVRPRIHNYVLSKIRIHHALFTSFYNEYSIGSKLTPEKDHLHFITSRRFIQIQLARTATIHTYSIALQLPLDPLTDLLLL